MKLPALAAAITLAASPALASPLTLTLTVDGQTQIFDDSATPDVIKLPQLVVMGDTVLFEGILATQTIGKVNVLSASALAITNAGPHRAVVSLILVGQGFAGPANVAYLSGAAMFNRTPGSALAMQWFDDPVPGIFTLPGYEVGECEVHATVLTSAASCTSSMVKLAHPDTGPFSLVGQWQGEIAPGGSLWFGQTAIAKESP